MKIIDENLMKQNKRFFHYKDRLIMVWADLRFEWLKGFIILDDYNDLTTEDQRSKSYQNVVTLSVKSLLGANNFISVKN